MFATLLLDFSLSLTCYRYVFSFSVSFLFLLFCRIIFILFYFNLLHQCGFVFGLTWLIHSMRSEYCLSFVCVLAFISVRSVYVEKSFLLPVLLHLLVYHCHKIECSNEWFVEANEYIYIQSNSIQIQKVLFYILSAYVYISIYIICGYKMFAHAVWTINLQHIRNIRLFVRSFVHFPYYTVPFSVCLYCFLRVFFLYNIFLEYTYYIPLPFEFFIRTTFNVESSSSSSSRRSENWIDGLDSKVDEWM